VLEGHTTTPVATFERVDLSAVAVIGSSLLRRARLRHLQARGSGNRNERPEYSAGKEVIAGEAPRRDQRVVREARGGDEPYEFLGARAAALRVAGGPIDENGREGNGDPEGNADGRTLWQQQRRPSVMRSQ